MRAGIQRSEGGLLTTLSGEWRLDEPPPRFDELAAGADPDGSARSVGFDSSALEGWDSSLLAFLMQASRYCESNGLDFQGDGLPENVALLLELAGAVPEQVMAPEPAPQGLIARLGTKGLGSWDAFLGTVAFVGEVARSLVRFLLLRGKMRWRDFWMVVQSNSSGALPIVTLISFLVGLIIAFLGAVVLRRFGAGYYVSYLVGYGILREMASLMTGIIMAGRTGAGFAAELGSMKITEEIDALQTMGVSPVDHLVLPRVLGLFLVMPLLTIYAMAVGILGGMLAAIALLDLTVAQFMGGLLMAVTLPDALLGVFKGLVFGLIIGVAGCLRGVQAGSDAGAVGRAATSAVVTGITLIIAANAVIDWLAALLEI